MALSWHVIRTEPRSEYQAAAELERIGWPVFFPRLKKMRLRPEPVDSPLFPGYLFVKCDLERDGQISIRDVLHVVGWVQFDGTVPSVADDVIDALEQRVELVNRQGGLWARFRPGQKVRVASQLFNGLGEVVEDTRSPQANVKVLVEFMGRLVSAQVRRDDLVPIEETSGETSRNPRRTRGRRRWIRGFVPAGVANAQAASPL